MSKSNELLQKAHQPHKILRDIYRHYPEYRELVTSPQLDASGGIRTSDGVIEHGYYVYDEEGNIVEHHILTLSFWDLHGALEKLSARKREAVFYNVILDWRQVDVAERMGITTVSVGQYVDQAMQQLAKDYFVELFDDTEAGGSSRVRTGEEVHGETTRTNGGSTS